MDTTNNKAAPRNGTASRTPHPHYKRFPAYGKRLMGLRLNGQVPPNCVVVTFEWGIGRIFPRIVIPDSVPFNGLELSYLAGLDVIIVHRDKDASRVHALAQAILAVN